MSQIYEIVRNYSMAGMRAAKPSTLYNDNVFLSLKESLNRRNRTAMTTPRPKNKLLLTKSRLEL